MSGTNFTVEHRSLVSPLTNISPSSRDLIPTNNIHDAEKDKALRDRLVFGIQFSDVRAELYNTKGASTLQHAQTAPSAKPHAAHILSTTAHKHSSPCEYCGSHHKLRQCPAYGTECKLCHKKDVPIIIITNNSYIQS